MRAWPMRALALAAALALTGWAAWATRAAPGDQTLNVTGSEYVYAPNELFVRPAIRRMSGHALPFRRGVSLRAAEPITLKPKLQHFLRAIVSEGPGGLEARLTGPQGSGILTSLVAANALLVVPEGQHDTAAGADLTAIVLDDPGHTAEPPF